MANRQGLSAAGRGALAGAIGSALLVSIVSCVYSSTSNGAGGNQLGAYYGVFSLLLFMLAMHGPFGALSGALLGGIHALAATGKAASQKLAFILALAGGCGVGVIAWLSLHDLMESVAQGRVHQKYVLRTLLNDSDKPVWMLLFFGSCCLFWARYFRRPTPDEGKKR